MRPSQECSNVSERVAQFADLEATKDKPKAEAGAIQLDCQDKPKISVKDRMKLFDKLDAASKKNSVEPSRRRSRAERRTTVAGIIFPVPPQAEVPRTQESIPRREVSTEPASSVRKNPLPSNQAATPSNAPHTPAPIRAIAQKSQPSISSPNIQTPVGETAQQSRSSLNPSPLTSAPKVDNKDAIQEKDQDAPRKRNTNTRARNAERRKTTAISFTFEDKERNQSNTPSQAIPDREVNTGAASSIHQNPLFLRQTAITSPAPTKVSSGVSAQQPETSLSPITQQSNRVTPATASPLNVTPRKSPAGVTRTLLANPKPLSPITFITPSQNSAASNRSSAKKVASPSLSREDTSFSAAKNTFQALGQVVAPPTVSTVEKTAAESSSNSSIKHVSMSPSVKKPSVQSPLTQHSSMESETVNQACVQELVSKVSTSPQHKTNNSPAVSSSVVEQTTITSEDVDSIPKLAGTVQSKSDDLQPSLEIKEETKVAEEFNQVKPHKLLRPLKKIMPPPRKNTSRNPLKSLQKREDVEDDFNQEPEQPQAAVDEFDQIKSNELLKPAKRAQPPRRKHATKSRNPVKAALQKTRNLEAMEEEKNIEPVPDVKPKSKERKRSSEEKAVPKSGFTVEALAGLADKIDFAEIKLAGKQSDASLGLVMQPYKDIMLIQIKGRRHCQVRLVEPCADSLTSNGCFILVTSSSGLFVWLGKGTNVIERAKATELANYISSQHDLGCKKNCRPIIIEENRQQSSEAQKMKNLLGVSAATIHSRVYLDSFEHEQKLASLNRVYELVDSELQPVTKYWGKYLKHEMLQSNKCYVFDFGCELYTWAGSTATSTQRKNIARLATDMYKRGYDYSGFDINPFLPIKTPNESVPMVASKRPEWSLLGKVSEKLETSLFKEKFVNWPEKSTIISDKKLYTKTPPKSATPEKAEQNDYDVSQMIKEEHSKIVYKISLQDVGRGRFVTTIENDLERKYEILSLSVDVWQPKKSGSLHKLEKSSQGQFNEDDCYIVRWKYRRTPTGFKVRRRTIDTGRDQVVYFFWKGCKSSNLRQGKAAYKMSELAKDDEAPQIIVMQGKEPPCFLSLFDGKMTVHMSEREISSTHTASQARLYMVQNELPHESCLIEVPCSAESLRSRGTFILFNNLDNDAHVWQGNQASPHSLARAHEIVAALRTSCPQEMGLTSNKLQAVKDIAEGSETQRLWNFLGGESGHNSHLTDTTTTPSPATHTLRVFNMNSVNGELVATEVRSSTRNNEGIPCAFPVSQSELYDEVQPSLFLLDNSDVMYLWQGWWPEEDVNESDVKTGSAKDQFCENRRWAMQTALNYCRAKNPENPVPAYMVYAGMETREFTNLFPVWEAREGVRALQEKKTFMFPQDAPHGKLITVQDALKKC